MALKMAAFIPQEFAHRVNAFSAVFQKSFDRIYCQPINAQVRLLFAHFISDGQIPFHMAEANGTADPQNSGSTLLSCCGARRCCLRLQEI